MKNFAFEHNGKTLWYSRSLAANAIILRYDETKRDIFEVLACKRGQGCEFNKGLWNVPGGFIDFDEDVKECAIRETYEETGIQLPYDRVMFFKLDSTPKGARQTILAVTTAVFEKKDTDNWVFSTEHSEPNETEEIKWIDIRELSKYNWTRDQIKNINEVIEHYNWILKR